jgi:hypothetical protein
VDEHGDSDGGTEGENALVGDAKVEVSEEAIDSIRCSSHSVIEIGEVMNTGMLIPGCGKTHDNRDSIVTTFRRLMLASPLLDGFALH